MMLLTRFTAENALREAEIGNPGPWADHARYVAQACENIAKRCPHLDADDAYIYGILHDIGRHAGVTSEKHLIDGYRYCLARGWKKADKKPALNPDLWEVLLSLIDKHQVHYHWVKGHADNPYNNRCDALAVAESKRFN